MGFHNEEFPLVVGYGTTGGFGWKTSIIEMDSGQDQRVGRRSIFRKEFDARTGIRTLADFSLVRHFAASRRGSLHSFKVKDYADFTTGLNDVGTPTNLDVVLGTGNASNKDFQLRKRYGGVTYGVYWNITKPVSGTTAVALDGVAKTLGTDYTLNLLTGIVSFVTAPANGVAVTAGCEFRVPVFFGPEVDELLSISLEDVDVGDLPSVPMIEDMGTATIDDEFDYGGAASVALTVTTTMDLLSRMLTVTNSTGNMKMPVVTALPYGGPYLTVKNSSGATLTIVDSNSVTIGTILNGVTKQLWLALSAGSPAWLLV